VWKGRDNVAMAPPVGPERSSKLCSLP
jgi:hypothetical protein